MPDFHSQRQPQPNEYSSNEYSFDNAHINAHDQAHKAEHFMDEDANLENVARDEIVLSIPSDASYVRVVRLAVMGIASRMAFSFEDIEDIKLAVSEACNNAILHAQPNEMSSIGAASPVVVRLVVQPDRLEISVEDDGTIAPPGLVRPLAADASSLGILPEGGMGLFLIETLMDEVEHESGQKTVVRMTKYVSHDVSRDELDADSLSSRAPKEANSDIANSTQSDSFRTN